MALKFHNKIDGRLKMRMDRGEEERRRDEGERRNEERGERREEEREFKRKREN